MIVMNTLKNITGQSMESVSSDNYPFLMSIFTLLSLTELSSNFITDKTCSLKPLTITICCRLLNSKAVILQVIQKGFLICYSVEN